MKFGRIISTLNLAQIKGLLRFCIRHPLRFAATAFATVQCMKICDEKFEKDHHRNGLANAFRHALWNALILKYTLKSGSHPDKALAWTEQITLWHEDFSPNKELARAMDLHNNRYGRDFWRQGYFGPGTNDNEIAVLLQGELKSAIKIRSYEELPHCPDKMIYIED